MSVLNDHLKLVCSPVCSPLCLSCGLLYSLAHSLSCLHLTSGSAMNVAYGEEEMKRFLEEATQVSQVRSVLALCVHACTCETEMASIGHTLAFFMSRSCIELAR